MLLFTAAHEAMKRKQADREEIDRRLQLAQVQLLESSEKVCENPIYHVCGCVWCLRGGVCVSTSCV